MIVWLTSAVLAAPPCGTTAPVVADAEGLAPLLRAPRAVALVDAPWSSWSSRSAAVLDAALAQLPGVPAWCLDPVAERQRLWPWASGAHGIADPDTGVSCVYFAKGDSSPLLILEAGALVGCVQRPWSLSPAALADAVRAGHAGLSHPALSESR